MWLLMPLVHLVYKKVGINGDNKNKKMAFLQLDMVLIPLRVAVVESSISCLNLVVFLVQPF